jgi:hypothetical protein
MDIEHDIGLSKKFITIVNVFHLNFQVNYKSNISN